MPPRDQLLPAFLLPSVAAVVGLLVIPMVLWTVVHSADPAPALVAAATALTVAMALAVLHCAMRLMPADGFEPIAAEPAAPAEPLETV
jgi:hypothetical protein